jgi:hypothetical protein
VAQFPQNTFDKKSCTKRFTLNMRQSSMSLMFLTQKCLKLRNVTPPRSSTDLAKTLYHAHRRPQLVWPSGSKLEKGPLLTEFDVFNNLPPDRVRGFLWQRASPAIRSRWSQGDIFVVDWQKGSNLRFLSTNFAVLNALFLVRSSSEKNCRQLETTKERLSKNPSLSRTIKTNSEHDQPEFRSITPLGRI